MLYLFKFILYLFELNAAGGDGGVWVVVDFSSDVDGLSWDVASLVDAELGVHLTGDTTATTHFRVLFSPASQSTR